MIYLSHFLILLNLFHLGDIPLEGKWNLFRADNFTSIMTSPLYLSGTEEQQKQVSDMFEMALQNSYYDFYKDSVIWTDVKKSTKEMVRKRGKWNLKSDTLIIYDLDKIILYEYLISIENDVLEMKFIFPTGEISPNAMFYKKE
ncbi:hypothetical protein [Algoriphagus namhaensis]